MLNKHLCQKTVVIRADWVMKKKKDIPSIPPSKKRKSATVVEEENEDKHEMCIADIDHEEHSQMMFYVCLIHSHHYPSSKAASLCFVN